ncbi:MAG TPA: S41 family peptidase, partial [Anaerovoracaceae bacterium]|nr:S41 family peptidase [Anaerovoracaceae bacterium]
MDPRQARKIAKVIAIIVAFVMIVTSFSFVMLIPGLFGMEGAVVYAASSDTDLDQQLENLKEYIEYIQKNYKDDVTYEQLVDGAFAGVVDSLGDPYSVYYGSSLEGENFIESVTGEFSGVGLSLEDYNGQCRVVAPIPNTPADKSGIKSGDIVKKIDGIDITKKTLDEAVSMMRGEEGTKVTLQIDRDGKTLSFTLTREKIKNVSVNSRMLDDNIGYIQITSFDNDSHVEFRLAKVALVNKGAKALILDLRNNPGGLVNTALDIANQLMPEGPITHFEQKGKIVETYSADGNLELGIPMVLLVNEGSASASEILAGALQDSKTATLVGTTTYGKGVAQQVSELTDGSSMKLSMYYFLTPNKKRIDHVGITPDYTVQNSNNADEKELAEKYATFAPMTEKVKPKAGDTGLNVFGAQQRLAMLGYPVKVSGNMDEATVAAVTKFQTESKLYPSGILDFTTMGALEKATVHFITGTKEGEDLQLDKAE